MADIEVTPLEDGDALTHTSLNTPLQEIEAGINDLEEDASRRGAFGPQHLPSLVVAEDEKNVHSSGSSHTYLESQCPYAGGFLVISDGGGGAVSGTVLRTVFSPAINLANSSTPAIFVRAHLLIEEIKATSGGSTHDGRFAVFQIWIRDTSGGTEGGLVHTTRFAFQRNIDGPQFIHVPITTLITAANTTGAIDDVIDRVEVRMAIYDGSSPALVPDIEVIMRHCWLFTTVLHSSL